MANPHNTIIPTDAQCAYGPRSPKSLNFVTVSYFKHGAGVYNFELQHIAVTTLHVTSTYLCPILSSTQSLLLWAGCPLWSSSGTLPRCIPHRAGSRCRGSAAVLRIESRASFLLQIDRSPGCLGHQLACN